MLMIAHEDLPGTYTEADRVSLVGQKKYIFWVKADLILVAFGALLTVGSSKGPVGLAWLGAASMLASAVATYKAWRSPWAKLWFDARAVAESIKSLTWRYMTGADSFPKTLPPADAAAKFVDEVAEVLNQRKDIIEHISGPSKALDITPKMDEVRGLPLTQRRDVYLVSRIRDQQSWYSAKAKYNNTAKGRLYGLIMLLQVAACISAVAHARWPSFPFNFTGFVATLATSFLTWLQVRRHEELSKSYALAAQELSEAETVARYVDSGKGLSKLVCDVEQAISREHTLWVVRRTCSEGLTVKFGRRNQDAGAKDL